MPCGDHGLQVLTWAYTERRKLEIGTLASMNVCFVPDPFQQVCSVHRGLDVLIL